MRVAAIIAIAMPGPGDRCTERWIRHLESGDFAVTDDLRVCSENLYGVVANPRICVRSGYSEFLGCGGSYNRQALLQSRRSNEGNWSFGCDLPWGGLTGESAGRVWTSVGAGMPADAQDAAGLDDIQAECVGAVHNLLGF